MTLNFKLFNYLSMQINRMTSYKQVTFKVRPFAMVSVTLKMLQIM